ncbi:MAG: Txe/YoeB family addiction module toxin [Selenomonadaceae bacterium]|nr:Txe/YoeB family addiction module toxin [Selenomonadaceae bacterium]
MIKAWSDEAWEQFCYFLNEDKKTLKRILRLIRDIDHNGYNCIGKAEPLKHDLSGFWSVRIDGTNRIVFRINGDTLEIAQCGSHYGDK